MTPPLIGVTTSEIRRADAIEHVPEGEPPQHEMALGMPYVRALERAGAVPSCSRRSRSRSCPR